MSKKLKVRKKINEIMEVSKRTVLLGALDPDLIRRILRKKLHHFKFCYQEELVFNKVILGTTTNLKFLISPFGKVKNIACDHADQR